MKQSVLTILMFATVGAHAAPAAKAVAAKSSPKPAPKAAAAATPAADVQRALASVKSGSAPKRIDPNAALEVRGQSRTLSMMLVLKNGKDSINFIKVRKDYRPEIEATQY